MCRSCTKRSALQSWMDCCLFSGEIAETIVQPAVIQSFIVVKVVKAFFASLSFNLCHNQQVVKHVVPPDPPAPSQSVQAGTQTAHGIRVKEDSITLPCQPRNSRHGYCADCNSNPGAHHSIDKLLQWLGPCPWFQFYREPTPYQNHFKTTIKLCMRSGIHRGNVLFCYEYPGIQLAAVTGPPATQASSEAATDKAGDATSRWQQDKRRRNADAF